MSEASSGQGGDVWKRCSSCKRGIAHGEVYWVCSVSTCNRKRTGLVFCSTECWDAHLGIVPHRESFAVEERAPSRAQAEVAARQEAASAPASPPARRRRIASSPGPAAQPRGDPQVPRDVLIVASKLKSYIKARSGMNTSDRVLEPLSDEVRKLADRAIASARRAGRKTVLDRDV